MTLTGTIRATAQEAPLSGIPGSADVNFFSTSKWMGISGLRSGLRAIDPISGQFVDLDLSDVDFAAQSGRDYRFAITPVPLPGAAGMRGLGLLALLRRRTRAT